MSLILPLWQHIQELGAHYGVNPVVFALLYFAHHPLFWGTMAWLTARVRAKKPVVGVILLGIFFWFMPYTYVFVFGRGLPQWIYIVAIILASIGSLHAIREVKRRLSIKSG